MAAYSLLVFTLFAVASARPLDESLYLWNEWKATYNRQFSAYEEAARFSCFQTNLDIIDSLNAREGREIHGVNKFSALCPAEFKASHHNLKFNNRTSTNVAPLFSDEQVKKVLASDVDWRTKGAVTHVKDQGQCGSCWSFSATGNMEGQWFLSKNQLVGLSEEELVACSHNGNQGCNGGLMDYAFEWVTSNGGIDSEADYPYTSGTGRTGVCNTQKEKTFVAKFSSHQDVAKNEAQIATFLDSNGPVAIGVDAQSGWQTYRGGIMATCFGKQLDHGVLLVGYQGTGAEPYWIVKNSWGTSWGESGYIRLKYGSDQCGITQAASSAKV